MAKQVKWNTSDTFIEAKPKKTRQGLGKQSKYSATSRNGAKNAIKDKGNNGISKRYERRD